MIFLAAGLTFTTRPAPDVVPNVTPAPGSLQGRFLVAKPSMLDPRFAEMVILMVSHDKSGAFGLVINKPAGTAEIVDASPSAEDNDEDGFANQAESSRLYIVAYYGGPVEAEKSFIIHSVDYHIDTTETVTAKVAVTADPRILEDIAAGKGPKKLLYIVGYSGWGAGQLETELRHDDWFIAPVDADLIFSVEESSAKWRRAVDMRLRGI